MQSLDGKWDAVVDLYDQGRKNKIYLNRKPEGKTDFYEYAFENGLRLDVPSDWNSQTPELKYYEGTVWYARRFDAPRRDGRRLFLHFGAVSYRCRVYLNGEEIGSHEGGFTPFQIEVTGKLKPADNFLARGGEQHAYARRHSGDGFRLVELRRHHARRVARQRSRSLRRGLFHPP